MKILVAKFQLEANEHVPMMCDLENTALSFDHECLHHMQLGNVFDQEDITLIPVLCADAAKPNNKGAYKIKDPINKKNFFIFPHLLIILILYV